MLEGNAYLWENFKMMDLVIGELAVYQKAEM